MADIHTISTKGTLVVFDDRETPFYAARGITQTLRQITQGGQQKRTVNGSLKDLSNHAFRKYAIELSCTDQAAPPIDGVYLGQELTVELAVELYYSTGATGVTGPGRTAATGSTRSADGLQFYRPVLDILVTEYEVRHDEWAATYSWTLRGEEV